MWSNIIEAQLHLFHVEKAQAERIQFHSAHK